jgi:RHS repeat-associated protein
VWAQGDSNSFNAPRPLSIAVTDERNQTKGTEFIYGASYNQVTEVRNYDYGYVYQGGNNSLLRKTTTQYLTAQGYLNQHIYNLPQSVEVSAGDGTRLARTEYQYDGGTPNGAATLASLPTSVTQHDEAYNPFAPSIWVPEDCYCVYDENNECVWTCDPGYWNTAYQAQTDYRGNLTQVKSYADAATLDSATAVVETRQYDITGNMVLATTACCQQTTVSYTAGTQYAYPEAQTRGSATDAAVSLTTSAAYDFNTGLTRNGTNADGRTTQSSYYPDTLRPQAVTLPTGAHTDYTYDDAGMSITATTYLAAGLPDNGAVAEQNTKWLNGLGQVRQEQALAAGSGANSVWDFVDTQYDVLGQVAQQSRPYRAGDTKQWHKTTYDALGRVSSEQAPDGTTPQTGSMSQTFYNEAARPGVANQTAPGQTSRVVDAWGRERWARYDALDRLVEVVEPDPQGSGSVATGGYKTSYSYDALGNLTGVTQDTQTRTFKYDALGRLTKQKLAEASATLDANGNYVGAGGTWSDAFTYDTRSNLVARTDARGVRTSFNYNLDPTHADPLNRLHSIHYDTTGAHENLANSPIAAIATDIAYNYVTTGDITRLNSVTSSAGSETYYYSDAEKRLTNVAVVINGRSSYLLDYEYDSLDRLRKVTYPNEYGLTNAPRKDVQPSYDVASRLSGLQVGGVSYASELAYNAASQTTSLKVGPANSYQTTEHYGYNAQTGLLEHQDVTHATQGTLLNLDYSYLREGTTDGRTGQLTKVTDYLNRNRDRGYEYDALGRLQRATAGGTVGSWAQRYLYDRFGNRVNTLSQKTTDFVTNLYVVILNRQPDSGGLQAWTNYLNGFYPQGQASFLAAAKTTVAGFFDSQEYLNRNRTNTDYVTDLYGAYLNRAPDQAGLTAWVAALNGGASRASVRQGFADGSEFANRVSGLYPGVVGASSVARDGVGGTSFDSSTNRINAAGWEYDAAGNQTRALAPSGSWLRYEYDAAGRLVKVKNDANQPLSTYTYGDSNQRLSTEEGTTRTYYVWVGGAVIAEYTEDVSVNIPAWTKSYVYLGGRLLATLQPNGSSEAVQYQHPDRLGTRLVTNGGDNSNSEQATLPYGTALDAETTGATNRRFTSYDRSSVSKLDYAVNRYYDSLQGRFTQVDPIGMGAASLGNPQSLNLYAYCGNDPVNHTDPSGLLFGWLTRLIRRVVHALVQAVVAAAIAFVTSGFSPHAALVAGVAAFLKDLGWPSKGWLPSVGRTTPGYNPNAAAVLSTGVSGLNRYIIYNFGASARLPAWLAQVGGITSLLQGWHTASRRGPLVGGKPIRCPPTGSELANNKIVLGALRRAWRDSQYATANAHEEGGWIYQNTSTGRIATRRAPRGAESSIVLDSPPHLTGYLVVGIFHTHPNPTSEGWDPHPDQRDDIYALTHGIPGLVMSDSGIFPFGPNRTGGDPGSTLPAWFWGTGEYWDKSYDTRQNCP